MGHTSFNPCLGELNCPPSYSREGMTQIPSDVFVALDTGASTTMIPTEVAVDLGYVLVHSPSRADVYEASSRYKGGAAIHRTGNYRKAWVTYCNGTYLL